MKPWATWRSHPQLKHRTIVFRIYPSGRIESCTDAPGTEYIGRVELTFTAMNAAGFTQSGRATVDLRETDDGCGVGSARLYE